MVLHASPGLPMSLAQAAAYAAANKGKAIAHAPVARPTPTGGGAAESRPAPKSLVELVEEQKAKEAREKKKGGKAKAEWEGAHPWRPWNRETDLDVRAANPKGKESILNNQHMGKLGDRFGGGRRETTFM